MSGRLSVAALLLCTLAAISLFGTDSSVQAALIGDVEIHMNGGDDVAYVGDTNIVEIWILNDEELTGMAIGFELSAGRTYDVISGYGSFGYVNPEGDAVGAFDLFHGEDSAINDLSPDSLLIGGSSFAPGNGLPVHLTQALCYTFAVYIDAGQSALADGFCLDNIFYPPSGTWSFATASGGYAPDFQGNPNSSQANPDAPEVCFDIVVPYGTPPSITNCPTSSLVGPHNVGVTYQFAGFDPDPGDVLTWMVISGPGTIDQTGLYFSDSQEPDFYSVAVEVTDLAGNTDTCGFEILLTNEPPFFTNCPTSTQIITGGSYTYDFDAEDPDFCAPLIFAIESVNPSPTGVMSIGITSGIFTFEPDPLDAGTTFDVVVGVYDPHDAGLCAFAIEVPSTQLTDVIIGQIDWYDNFEVLVEENSVWGELTFLYVPSDTYTYYVNCAMAVPGEPLQWVTRNLPLFPTLLTGTRSDGCHINLEDLGLTTGTDLPEVEYVLTATSFPLTTMPTGPVDTADVVDLQAFYWSPESEGGIFVVSGRPDNVEIPEGSVQHGRTRDIDPAEHSEYRVQEEPRQCFAGAMARSLDWLNRIHQFYNEMTAQNFYDSLRGRGVGDDTPAFDTPTWLQKKADYASSISFDFIKTKAWDGGDYLPPMPGISQESVAGISLVDWLIREIGTEDVELDYSIDGGGAHIVTVVDVFTDPATGDVYVKFRDDLRQGNSAGDSRIKTTKLVPREDGRYGFDSEDRPIRFAVSESCRASSWQGLTSGPYVDSDEFWYHQDEYPRPQAATDFHMTFTASRKIVGWKMAVEGYGWIRITSMSDTEIDYKFDAGAIPECCTLRITCSHYFNDSHGRGMIWKTGFSNDHKAQRSYGKACPHFGRSVSSATEIESGIYRHLVTFHNYDSTESFHLQNGGMLLSDDAVEKLSDLDDFPITFSPVELTPGDSIVVAVVDTGGHAHLYGYVDLVNSDGHLDVRNWFDHPTGFFTCGDANADGLANITDAVYLIQYIFAGGPEPQPYIAGDANCDGVVNITDAVYLITYIFAGGPPPCDPDDDGVPDC